MNISSNVLTFTRAKRSPIKSVPFGSFRFNFEDLPLITEGGVKAGLVNGVATINYFAEPDDDYPWFVDQIYLEGFRELTDEERAHCAANNLSPKLFEQSYVEIIDRQSWLYLAIFDQLQDGPFNPSITDEVMKKIAIHCTDDMGV